MNITVKGGIEGVLNLRNVGERRILLGGTAGTVFKQKLLPQLFTKPLVVDEFPSLFHMLG